MVFSTPNKWGLAALMAVALAGCAYANPPRHRQRPLLGRFVHVNHRSLYVIKFFKAPRGYFIAKLMITSASGRGGVWTYMGMPATSSNALKLPEGTSYSSKIGLARMRTDLALGGRHAPRVLLVGVRGNTLTVCCIDVLPQHFTKVTGKELTAITAKVLSRR